MMDGLLSRSGRFAHLLVAAVSLMLFLTGCGHKSAFETGTIYGRITHHGGKPLTNATIHFLAPTLGAETTAEVGPDGKYAVDQPIRAGNYQVEVTPPVPAPAAEAGKLAPRAKPQENPDIPRKARDYKFSRLTATIKAGKNECNFDLTD